MSVYLYPGGFRLVHRSGVGQALLHQRKALTAAGIPLAQTMREGEIVHINTVFPDSLLAALAARLSGKKVVYYAHSTMEDFRRSFPGSNWFAPLFKRWIRLCYQMEDIIITPTDYSRNFLFVLRAWQNRPTYEKISYFYEYIPFFASVCIKQKTRNLFRK